MRKKINTKARKFTAWHYGGNKIGTVILSMKEYITETIDNAISLDINYNDGRPLKHCKILSRKEKEGKVELIYYYEGEYSHITFHSLFFENKLN